MKKIQKKQQNKFIKKASKDSVVLAAIQNGSTILDFKKSIKENNK